MHFTKKTPAKIRVELKQKLKNRQLIFGGWVSFSHPSITEIFSEINLDCINEFR